MEEYKVNIADSAYANIYNITDYITTVFNDEHLANLIAINILDEIKKLSYLAPMLQSVYIEVLKDKDIRRYRYKKYVIYYELDAINKNVNVLHIRHELQEENKFFGMK